MSPSPSPATGRTFAYCRVSTDGQTTVNQIQEIAAAGYTVAPQRVIAETVSGSVEASQRPGFAMLLNKLEAGDVLIVTKLDRLGRNAMDVRATVEGLSGMGVRVHCLALGGMDLTSPAGKMTMGVINAMAEFERDLLVERTQAGLARAKAEGKTLGRPKSLLDDVLAQAQARIKAGEPVASIARDLKTSRQTIMRVRDEMEATA